MISAEEARNKTKDKIEDNLRKEIADIESLINDAIEKGLYSVYIDKYLKKEIHEYLKDLEYDVKSNTCRNETNTRISWE